LVQKTIGFEDDKPGVYTRVDDGWWGIVSHDQDRVAQESQGDIYDRSKEHLGAADEGVILLRNLILESIEACVSAKILLDAAPAGAQRTDHFRRQHGRDRALG
jgi:hypothetical protein